MAKVTASIQVLGYVKGAKDDEEVRREFRQYLSQTGLKYRLSKCGFEFDAISLESDSEDGVEVIAGFAKEGE